MPWLGTTIRMSQMCTIVTVTNYRVKWESIRNRLPAIEGTKQNRALSYAKAGVPRPGKPQPAKLGQFARLCLPCRCLRPFAFVPRLMRKLRDEREFIDAGTLREHLEVN